MKSKTKKRIVVNKPSQKECEICKEVISLYSFGSHIKWKHNITSDEYVSKFGEFRKIKKEPIVKRNIQILNCGICKKEYSSVGMFVHLRDGHGLSPDEYVVKYGEYRPSKIREKSYADRLETVDESDKQYCIICGDPFASGTLLGGHIKKEHVITKKEYIRIHILKGEKPLCKCGCGMTTKILNYVPYRTDYRSGHNSVGQNNSMYGKTFSVESRKKMSDKAVDRIIKDVGKKTDTVPELKFKAILDRFGEPYEHPFKITGGVADFYLTKRDLLVEIDGVYWHPEKLENLNFGRIPNVISDYKKSSIPNLIRIREDVIDGITDLENLKDFSFDYKYEFGFRQKVIEKDYFSKCLSLKGKTYLKDNVKTLLKFLRTFQPNLPELPLEENLVDVMKSISKTDFSKVYDPVKREFSNKGSTIGHNYLKHYFKSYWKSRFKKNPSPYDAWLDDKIMSDVISYRIGLNDSNEIFDFSLQQMITGMSARRLTVSFFKPTLAASIYKHYLGDNKSPTVLDPCCGFGGRLLGFKSVYPNGKYIGCEPNVETYNELVGMVKRENLSGVTLFNCKFEDYTGTFDVDLTFTSIPYHDLEVYSNSVGYKNFDSWKTEFIDSIEDRCKNCYINTNQDCADVIGWKSTDNYITSNSTHFSKNSSPIREVIVKVSK